MASTLTSPIYLYISLYLSVKETELEIVLKFCLLDLVEVTRIVKLGFPNQTKCDFRKGTITNGY